MLHTRNVAKAQNYNSRKFGVKMSLKIRSTIFSTKQLHLFILCTFPRFGESGFGESGPPSAKIQMVIRVYPPRVVWSMSCLSYRRCTCIMTTMSVCRSARADRSFWCAVRSLGPKWLSQFGPWLLRSLVISVLQKRTEVTKDRSDHTPCLFLE